MLMTAVCNEQFQFQEVGYIPDKVVKAERRIAGSPFDTEAWSVLIRDAQVRKGVNLL